MHQYILILEILMKPKTVISPGLPRSGTTYTFRSLMEGENRKYFNVPKTKEINFFSQDRNINEFYSSFHEKDDNKIYIDYSPSYLTSTANNFDHLIEHKKEMDFKFILHLRHPIDQMYAHYLHEIKAHISKRQLGDDVRYSFFSTKSLKKYSALRSNAIEKLINHFGNENILTINFYTDIPNPKSLERKIGDFLNLDLSGFPAQKVSPGGWVPYYIYGGKEGVEVTIGNNIKTLPKRSLLLVNGQDSMIWHDIEESIANKLIEGSSTWTREVEEEQFGEMFDVLKDDWQKTMSLLNESSENYNTKKHLKSNPAPMDNSILELLSPFTVKLKDRLNDCTYKV